jgi:two-component system cell cycle response regulator DivK
MDTNPAILYVDDDPLSRTVVELLLNLRMKLPRVTLFENSENFMERVLALETKPDVIFLDIHVTPLNGFEMLRLLRKHEQFRETPIVALTASVMSDEVVALRVAGFDGCLAKPINMDSFPAALARILNRDEVWSIIEG